jgi:hypothetical protein
LQNLTSGCSVEQYHDPSFSKASARKRDTNLAKRRKPSEGTVPFTSDRLGQRALVEVGSLLSG